MNPVQPVNHRYSDEDRVAAYYDITQAALNIGHMEKALRAYWDIFVPYLLPAPADHENDLVAVTQDRFDVLHSRATLWYTEYRFKDIYSRLAELEERG